MAYSNWNSNTYLKFKNQRTRPATDLINRIDISPKSILDLGCGPGNSTAELFKHFKNAEILGVDFSDDMLKKATENFKGSEFSNVNFKKCNIPDDLSKLNRNFDLIFSNACIHWIPNHASLLNSLVLKLNNNGALAVQIPLTYDADFYKILYKMIDCKKWEKLKKIKVFYNLLPEEYYDILSDTEQNLKTNFNCNFYFDIWQTTYYHTVNDFSEIIN